MQQVNTAQFDAEALQSRQPVLVDFFTSGCVACQDLAPLLEEVARETTAALKVVTVDAGAEQELAAHYRVMSVPSLFLFREGQCIGQRTGFCTRRALLAWLEAAWP